LKRSSALSEAALTRPGVTNTATVTGISPLWIKASSTAGALNWMPSWLTYRQAALAGSYCFGT